MIQTIAGTRGRRWAQSARGHSPKPYSDTPLLSPLDKGGYRGVMRPTRRKSAMSMVEALVSILIVGVLMTAVLDTVGAGKLGQYKSGDRRVGHLLAQSLMSEILLQHYEEPVDLSSFGPESPETAGSRADYDDIDDYDKWSASPPQNKDGTEIADRTGWSRTVVVEYADPSDAAQKAGFDSGIKRITVTVTHNDVVVASITAIRTGARDRLSRELMKPVEITN